jgi:acetylornithine deacetylase
VHFENAVTMPAFQVEKDAYIVKRLNEAYEAVRPGVTQPTGALAPQCFYGSDAGHLYKTLGMQGVVCGPGGKYNTMPDERVEVGSHDEDLYGKECVRTDRMWQVSDYMDCIKMFIRLIVDVCA